MQKSSVHRLCNNLPPRHFLLRNAQVAGILETSSTFRLPLLRLGSVPPGRAEGGGISPLEEIEKGWRERQEAWVINC